MSLINQVLKDLDARQPENGPQTVLPNDVRPLPAPRKSGRLVVLLPLLLISLAVGYFYGEWERWLPESMSEPQAQQTSTPDPVVPAPVPLPVAVSQPVVAPPVVQEVPVQALAEVPPAKSELALPALAVERDLRMSDEITSPIDTKNEKKTVARAAPVKTATVAPVSPKVVGNQGEGGSSRAESVVRPPLLSPPAKNLAKREATVSIERTEVMGSPRERAEAEYRKAIAALNLGRETEALEGLRVALRQDAVHTASRQLLVKLLLESKRRDEAMSLLQEGLQEQPAQIGWAMSLARLQMDRGDLSGAWKTLDHSLPAAGNSSDYQGFAGHVLQRLGRSREAAERYSLAAKLAPGDGRWWLGLGLACEAEGRSTDARAAFSRAKQSGNLSAELAAMVEHRLR